MSYWVGAVPLPTLLSRAYCVPAISSRGQNAKLMPNALTYTMGCFWLPISTPLSTPD